MRRVRRVAVVTSGGDAPGMNAAIRAVVRSANAHDVQALGVFGGYAGLVEGRFQPLSDRSVGGILQRGGTILGCSRFPPFCDAPAQSDAIDQLRGAKVDGLVVIGGNGSQCGTLALHEQGFPAVGVASTIDNDLAETEMTIGVDTALNTAVWLHRSTQRHGERTPSRVYRRNDGARVWLSRTHRRAGDRSRGSARARGCV